MKRFKMWEFSLTGTAFAIVLSLGLSGCLANPPFGPTVLPSPTPTNSNPTSGCLVPVSAPTILLANFINFEVVRNHSQFDALPFWKGLIPADPCDFSKDMLVIQTFSTPGCAGGDTFQGSSACYFPDHVELTLIYVPVAPMPCNVASSEGEMFLIMPNSSTPVDVTVSTEP